MKSVPARAQKTIACLLTLLLTALPLLSCAAAENEASKETDPVQTEHPDPIDADTGPATDENGYLCDELPQLDFGGETIHLLHWSDVENQEFESEELTGEIVNDAVFQRNTNVEDRLNIRYDWIGTPGNGGNIEPYVKKVRESHTAGDNSYDILASYSRSIASCLVNGFLANLESAAYLDYEKPWWPDNLLEESTINDHLYFVSGDISTNALHMMYCVYFNRQLLENFSLPNPQELVAENQWTIDKMIEMTNGTYIDLNGNGKSDIDDQFGFTITNFHNDAFYTGSGLKLVDKDPEKILVISEDFYSEKAVDLLAKLGPWEASDEVYKKDNYEKPFTDGRALFNINRAHYAAKSLRDSELSYGIVPVPKFDAEQKNFRTVMGNPVTLYGVTIGNPKKDTCTAVLECMASNAYRLTTPAIFENNMKKKYSTDDANAQMYDIVRESISFELGRFFNKFLSDITDIFFAEVENNRQNWASVSEKKREKLTKQIADVVAKIVENEPNLA